jgi:hypothetical protein
VDTMTSDNGLRRRRYGEQLKTQVVAEW